MSKSAVDRRATYAASRLRAYKDGKPTVALRCVSRRSSPSTLRGDGHRVGYDRRSDRYR